MIEPKHISNWREVVSFSQEGPNPQILVEKGKLKLVVAGLLSGQAIPPHEESLGIYHFLEGNGQMAVNEEQFEVQAGATVIAPKGALRGIRAASDLAFMAARITPCHKEDEEHCDHD